MSEQDRIDATVRLWVAAIREHGRPLTGDMRVSEADAALLLGFDPGSLKNKRHEGAGPPAYAVGVGRGRISYRLHDMARWLEEQRF